jgi:hypothetical protein
MENTWGHFDGRSDNCLYDLALRIAARVGTGTVQRIKAEMGGVAAHDNRCRRGRDTFTISALLRFARHCGSQRGIPTAGGRGPWQR